MDFNTIFLYGINIIVMIFTVFLFLLSDSIVFGCNFVFLVTQLPRTYQNYDRTFVLFTLLVTYIFNYKNSIDNSTYCGNAINSIVLFVVCFLYGAHYFYVTKEEMMSPLEALPALAALPAAPESLFTTNIAPFPYRNYFIYLKFIMVILMDWFYQPNARDEWYLLSCFVVFIGNKQILPGRYTFPFFGLLIGNFYRSFAEWMWYSSFCVVCLVIDVFILSKP